MKNLGKSKQSWGLFHFTILSVTSRFKDQTSISRTLSVYNYCAANESSTNDRSTGSPN